MKKVLLTSVLALSVLTLPVMVMAQHTLPTIKQDPAPTPLTDDFKFDEKYWSPVLIEMIKQGPKVLPADMAITLMPYPANTSDAAKAELDALKKMALEERTEDNLKRIHHENTVVPLYKVFADEGLYNYESHPLTNSLLATVNHEVAYFILREKMALQRPRPTQLAPDLTTVIDVPPHSAYPSGHAGQAFALGLMLAHLDEANADKYKKFAIDIGHRREIAGVHYPSDSAAGRELASRVLAALLEKPEIQERVALAKKEFEVQVAKESK